MSKPRRGNNAKKIKNWRGTCPTCERKRVKVLWPSTINGKQVMVCKKCYAGGDHPAD